MSTIRVAWGSATGPTRLAAYDAALAAANCQDYNLDRLSSVIPADTPVEAVGTAPDLGAAGNRLSVVESSTTVERGRAVAGLGWAVSEDEHGIFYEVTGETETEVRETLETGLRAGCELRGWSAIEPETAIEVGRVGVEPAEATPISDGGFGVEDTETAENAPSPDDERSAYASAVVLAAYGHSERIV